MELNPGIASVAFLIADPARAVMLAALLDGRALPAGELAHAAQVTPQTASSNLAKMLEGGLLTCEREGRHRATTAWPVRTSPRRWSISRRSVRRSRSDESR